MSFKNVQLEASVEPQRGQLEDFVEPKGCGWRL